MTSTSTRAVLFDLDGTLVDTLVDIAEAMNHALSRFGYPGHAAETYRRFVGDGVLRLAERALPEEGQGDRDTIVAAFRAYYGAHLTDASGPYPGIPELLRALEERSVPLAVLSNKPQPATEQLIGRLFGATRFVAVVGERPDVPRKPDPTSALGIARSVGVAPGACLLVGDSGTDVQTARAAGMVAVGVAWGFRGRAELERHGADAILERPRDLLPLLDV